MAGKMTTLSEIAEQFAITSNQVSSIVYTLIDDCRQVKSQSEKCMIVINEQTKIINLYKEKYGVIEKPNESGKEKTLSFPNNKDGKSDKKPT